VESVRQCGDGSTGGYASGGKRRVENETDVRDPRRE